MNFGTRGWCYRPSDCTRLLPGLCAYANSGVHVLYLPQVSVHFREAWVS